jgi:thiosulfate/3-mercaptopyruvate sulfurtransferase
VVAPPEAYGADEAARALALEQMGQQARADGFAHPEFMVSVPELAAALGHPDLVVLDVRPPERFQEGHIPTARQLYRGDYSASDPTPGLSLDAEALRALLARLGVKAGDQVVAYTDGGPEAYRLWWTLRQVAQVSIRVLDGGLQQWKARGHGLAMGDGLPAERAAPLVAPAQPQPHRATWEDASAFLARSPGAVLLDTRGQDEFLGQRQHKKAARKGHIPGAKHLDWFTVVRSAEDDHRLQAPQGLAALFAQYGVQADTPVLTYCQSGTRSAAVFFALYQMGRPEQAQMNYDGSWAEYSRTDLPAEVASP